MAGMQRFVTYLYYYKGNEKLHNAGFAKIEIRGGQCRIQMHIKGAMSKDTLPGVYLFSREEEMIHAVEVGKLAVTTGGSECNRIFSSENIAGSPYNIYNMKGIWIPVNEEYMFASQWDDGGILREKIRIWKPEDMHPSPDARQPATEMLESQPDTRQPVTEMLQSQKDNAQLTRETVESQPDTAQPATEMLESQPDTTQPTTESIQPDSKILQTTPKNIQIPPEVQATGLPQQESLTQENTLLESFLKIQKREQTIEVFETGKRQVMGIHIRLSDLRELPKRYWNLGNNSFLLHGFFTYQYLLLGKRTEGEQEYIFIGVPGTFHSQEQIMASLFGFGDFLPGRFHDYTGNSNRKLQEIDSSRQLVETLRAAETQTEPQEPFGYWCHFIV